MISKLSKLFDEHSDELKKFIMTHNRKEYMPDKLLLKHIFELCINPYVVYPYDTSDIRLLIQQNPNMGVTFEIYTIHKLPYDIKEIDDFMYTFMAASDEYIETLTKVDSNAIASEHEADVYICLAKQYVSRCHQLVDGYYLKSVVDDL